MNEPLAPRSQQCGRMISFAGWEMFLMRLGVAWLVGFHEDINYVSAPFPNGIAHWVDLTFLCREGVMPILRGLMVPALALYVFGRLTVVALGYIVAVAICVGTFENSQGAINHSRQLLAMVLLAQWLVIVWDIGREALCGKFRVWKDDSERQRKIVHAARVLIAAAYLTSAISKEDRSHGEWLMRTHNLAVEIVKTHANWYYDTLEATSPFFGKTVPQWMVEHRRLTRVLFAPGLLLEVFLFLGLLGRGWSLVMGASTILLHWGIGLLMMLFFDTHVWLLAIFFVNPAYWLAASAHRVSKWFDAPQAAGGALA